MSETLVISARAASGTTGAARAPDVTRPGCSWTARVLADGSALPRVLTGHAGGASPRWRGPR